MSRSMVGLLLVCALSLCGCSREQQKQDEAKQPTKSHTLNEAIYLDIIPLADGGAYARGFDGDIWYMREGEAVKVKEVSQLSVQPTASLRTKQERGLWALLQRERAKRVDAESERDTYADNHGEVEPDYEY